MHRRYALSIKIPGIKLFLRPDPGRVRPRYVRKTYLNLSLLSLRVGIVRLSIHLLTDMTKSKSKLFEIGFFDAWNGKDCRFILNGYINGYLKGIETAKSCGRKTYKKLW